MEFFFKDFLLDVSFSCFVDEDVTGFLEEILFAPGLFGVEVLKHGG